MRMRPSTSVTGANAAGRGRLLAVVDYVAAGAEVPTPPLLYVEGAAGDDPAVIECDGVYQASMSRLGGFFGKKAALQRAGSA